MDVLNDKMEGFSGGSEKSLRLRRLWEQAWCRTATQVDIELPSPVAQHAFQINLNSVK